MCLKDLHLLKSQESQITWIIVKEFPTLTRKIAMGTKWEMPVTAVHIFPTRTRSEISFY